MNDIQPPTLGSLSAAAVEIFANEVFQRYSLRLLQLANDRLGKDLRAKISPEDVVQSAFKSFFRRLSDFDFNGDSTDAIWALLSIITIRKCKKWDAFYRCRKRSVSREIANTDAANHSRRASDVAIEPGPEDAIVVAELLEQLFSQLEPRQSRMLLLRIEGSSIEEIAEQCQSSCRTVARTIATAKRILSDYLVDG